MNEAQRQRYLKAMGLTPWVARMPLPGAAPSPELDWQQETEGSPAQVAVGTPVASPQRPVARPAAPTSQVADEPMRERSTPTSQTPHKPSAVAAGEALTFTLEAHLAGDTWLVFQQEDAQAPGLGRHTGALAVSLLTVFESAPVRPRRFYCPLTGQPTNGDEAHQALRAFFNGLARQHGGGRVLLCLDEALAMALFEGERYRRFELGDLTALVISSLTEMLTDPPRHKRRSWQAMRAEGFDGRPA